MEHHTVTMEDVGVERVDHEEDEGKMGYQRYKKRVNDGISNPEMLNRFGIACHSQLPKRK